MARELARLRDRQVRTAKPKGKTANGTPRDTLMLCDGGGLYLQVTLGREGNVRRSWIFRYQRRGEPRPRDMGLGSLNDVSLAEAREIARKNRRLVSEGKDPIRERNAEIARNLAASAVVMTFDQAAATYIQQHRSSWTNPIHAAQWPASLRRYASPAIGRMAIADIDTPHILKVLNPIWHTKPETAKRLRGRIEAVLGWATVGGFRKDENGHDKPNPARWRGHLATSLAAPGKAHKRRHQPALSYPLMPEFMQDLRQRRGMAALALEFTALTVVRATDVLTAKRSHINRAERRWDIPHLSKTGLPHRVPLSDAALAVIDKAEKIASEIGGAVGNSDLLFPNDVTGKALHANALLAVLARMGRKGTMTTHGLRSSFRTWAQERTNFPWELGELSLGHKIGNQVARAYARGDALQKRTAIMQHWANFLTTPIQPATVIPLARAGV
jgi:integrase